MPSDGFLKAYHRHCVSAAERQMDVEALLDGLPPERLPEQAGTLSWGDRTLSFEPLGTYSTGERTWRWSWLSAHRATTDGPASADSARSLASKIRPLADRLDIPELGAPITNCDAAVADWFSCLIVGLLEADGYCKLPTTTGCRTLLVAGAERRAHPADPLRHIMQVMPRVMATILIIDHQAAFAGYCQSLTLSIESPSPDRVEAFQELNPSRRLCARLDAQRRLSSLELIGDELSAAAP